MGHPARGPRFERDVLGFLREGEEVGSSDVRV
jgi:hypothetical protein